MFKKYIKILFITFILVSSTFAQDSTWQITGEMKYPVSGARAVVVDSLIYVIGGYSDSLQANVNWIQSFNPLTNKWKIEAKMIAKRYGFFAGIKGEKLYIYGGINEVNDNAFILEEWDFQSPSTKIVSENELFDRVFSTGTIYGNKIIMVGGYSGSRGSSASLPYITYYNFDTNNILTLDDSSYQSNELPIQQLSARVEDKLYLIGGTFNGVLQDYHVMDLNSLAEVNFAERVISPRAAGVAVYSINTNSIYLIGGYNEVSPAIATTEIITNPELYPSVEPGVPLNYARRNLSAVEFEGEIFVFGGENASGEVISYIESFQTLPVSVVEEDDLTKDFILYQNYPNPFNPTTKISYTLAAGDEIVIEVFNSLGEKINELYRGYSNPGSYSVNWNGTNSVGEAMPTGVYFYRLTSSENFITKKMLLIK